MAGLMTQSGTLGFVGGMDIPLIRKFWAGYAAGAMYENDTIADADILDSYVGDWGDPATGKSLAETQITSGADIIFAAAGSSGLGALEACNEADDVFGIGVDSDQDYLYPGKILCSMLKRVDNAVYQQIEKVQKDQWASGIFSLGMAEGGVDISMLQYTHELIPDKYEVEMQTLKDMIINGTIVVPSNATELAAFDMTRDYTLEETTIPHPFTTTTTPATTGTEDTDTETQPPTTEPGTTPLPSPGFVILVILSSLTALPVLKWLRRRH